MAESQIKIHAHEIENKKTLDRILADLNPEQMAACLYLAGHCVDLVRGAINAETNLQSKREMLAKLEQSTVSIACDFALACVLKGLNVCRLKFASDFDIWHNYIQLQIFVNRVDCTISDAVDLRHVD